MQVVLALFAFTAAVSGIPIVSLPSQHGALIQEVSNTTELAVLQPPRRKPALKGKLASSFCVDVTFDLSAALAGVPIKVSIGGEMTVTGQGLNSRDLTEEQQAAIDDGTIAEPGATLGRKKKVVVEFAGKISIALDLGIAAISVWMKGSMKITLDFAVVERKMIEKGLEKFGLATVAEAALESKKKLGDKFDTATKLSNQFVNTARTNALQGIITSEEYDRETQIAGHDKLILQRYLVRAVADLLSNVKSAAATMANNKRPWKLMLEVMKAKYATSAGALSCRNYGEKTAFLKPNAVRPSRVVTAAMTLVSYEGLSEWNMEVAHYALCYMITEGNSWAGLDAVLQTSIAGFFPELFEEEITTAEFKDAIDEMVVAFPDYDPLNAYDQDFFEFIQNIEDLPIGEFIAEFVADPANRESMTRVKNPRPAPFLKFDYGLSVGFTISLGKLPTFCKPGYAASMSTGMTGSYDTQNGWGEKSYSGNLELTLGNTVSASITYPRYLGGVLQKFPSWNDMSLVVRLSFEVPKATKDAVEAKVLQIEQISMTAMKVVNAFTVPRGKRYTSLADFVNKYVTENFCDGVEKDKGIKVAQESAAVSSVRRALRKAMPFLTSLYATLGDDSGSNLNSMTSGIKNLAEAGFKASADALGVGGVTQASHLGAELVITRKGGKYKKCTIGLVVDDTTSASISFPGIATVNIGLKKEIVYALGKKGKEE